MGTGQGKASSLVLCKRERGRMIALEVVAEFALVEIWRSGKLSLVFILVAIRALGEFDEISRVLSLGNMATAALHFCMFELQWVCSLRMFFYRERGGLEAPYSVA